LRIKLENNGRTIGTELAPDAITQAIHWPPRSLACHWRVAGEGAATLFCGIDRGSSAHPSYCRHNALRSVVAVDDAPVVGVRPRAMAAA
jgi:hypothetical protein